MPSLLVVQFVYFGRNFSLVLAIVSVENWVMSRVGLQRSVHARTHTTDATKTNIQDGLRFEEKAPLLEIKRSMNVYMERSSTAYG
jgi:hypothetical protein